jgi:alpha/beta superfamily hydrolase
MGEKGVFFQSQGLNIQGLLSDLPADRAVVVTHPHPLFGGDMLNNVVESLVQAYNEMGYSSLRFNFRGVGQSEGRFDEGRGEQEDVKGALDYMSGLGKTQIDLAGYSFGAWVNGLSLETGHQSTRVIMVSPPVNFMDFSFLKQNDKIKLVISGSRDDIAPPAMIKESIRDWNPEAHFEIIQGADHFYFGRTDKLRRIVEAFLQEQ